MEGTTRLSNITQRYDAGCQYPELLISNYDTTQRAKSMAQLSLFDDSDGDPTLLLNERIYYHEKKCA